MQEKFIQIYGENL